MDLALLSKQDLIRINLEQQRQIDQLKFELDQLKRAIFGSKSERFIPDQNPEQSSLFGKEEGEQVPDITKEIKVQKKKSKKSTRQKLPAHLRREELVIEPDLDTKEMKKIGEQVSEKMEIKPAEIYVKKTIRPKYIDTKGTIHIAPLSDPFPKCITGPSMAAHIAVQKYVDHLPLYRQSKIYHRQNIHLARSTLNNFVAKGASKLELLYKILDEVVMASDYLQADESSIPVLTKDKPGSTMKGCMLAKVAPLKNLVVFDYIKTKEKINILQSLGSFLGYLQVDGNVSYEHKGAEHGVSLMHCLVHSRRKFDQALDYHREKASWVLSEIKKLYLIERQIKEEQLNIEQVFKRRQELSVPILLQLRQWLESNYHPSQPGNPLQTAIRYMLKRWGGLIKYTTNGVLRPDNNLIENQIRALALGRKNYLFAGSHEGARYAAIFYSFFATCKLNGLDPHKWLTDVYRRIDDHNIQELKQLLPTAHYQFKYSD